MHLDNDAGTFTVLDKERNCLVTYDILSGDEVAAADRPVNALAAQPYTVGISQLICTYLREGKTMTQISKMEGMPRTGQVYGWMNRYPDFKHNVKQARLDRGHFFHDQIVDKAKELDESDSEEITTLGLQKDRIVIDTYKWAAEKNNPDAYGARTKISGDAENPIGIQIIDTGIRRRDPEPVTVEAESRTIEEEEPEE